MNNTNNKNMDKLKFYLVDNSYLNYLNKIDDHVPQSKETNKSKEYKFDKFYIGILLKIENKYYVAPVSSNKNNYNTSLLIRNENNKIVGSIRFNYMIPVSKSNIKILDFSMFDSKRTNFLNIQLDDCNKNRDIIYNKARREYKYGIYKNHPNFIAYCDFKKLEKACDLYIKFQEFNNMYLINNDISLNDVNLDIIDNQLVVRYNDDKLITFNEYSDVPSMIDEIIYKEDNKLKSNL